MTRRRDYQKDKVYRAEQEIDDTPAVRRRIRLYRSDVAIRKDIDRMVHSRWWKRRFPHVRDVALDPGDSDDGWVEADFVPRYQVGVVRIGRPNARYKAVLCHELAHVIVESDPKARRRWAIHGPEFVGLCLLLWKKFVSSSYYQRAREVFDERGVEYIDPEEAENLWKRK